MEKSKKQHKDIPPALTREGRENQMISYAVDLAEKQLREGTASSQLIVHYLKLATTTAKLEKELLESKNELMKAKTEAIKQAAEMETLYSNAIAAMTIYQGRADD